MSGFARKIQRRNCRLRAGGILLAGVLLLCNPTAAQENSQTTPRPLTTPDAHFAEAFEDAYILEDWEADQADIHWMVLAEEAVFIAEFRIRFRDAASDGDWREYTVSADSREFRLFELLPERAYIAQVKALAATGQGQFGDSEWAEVAVPRAFDTPEMRLIDAYTVRWQKVEGAPTSQQYDMYFTYLSPVIRTILMDETQDIAAKLHRNIPKHILGPATDDIRNRIRCEKRSEGECSAHMIGPIAWPDTSLVLVACETEKFEHKWSTCQQRPTSFRASKTTILTAQSPYERYPLPAPQCPHHTHLWLFSRTFSLRYILDGYEDWICTNWLINVCVDRPGKDGAALVDRFLAQLQRDMQLHQRKQPDLQAIDLIDQNTQNLLNPGGSRLSYLDHLVQPELGVVAQETSQPVYCETGTTRRPGS